MAHINVANAGLALDEPTLLDGLPGKGLVGKLIADYVVSELEMEYYAGVHCEGVPSVAAYRPSESRVRPPIQLYADAERDLLALVSDIPISTANAPEFATCLIDWLRRNSVVPVYVSGLPGTALNDDAPERRLYGLSTGGGERLLEEADVEPPRHAGMVTGPTGALLNRSADEGLDSVGFLVETDDALPDYEAAKTVIERGVGPVAGLDVDTRPFEDGSIEMSPVAESALSQLDDSDDGSTSAKPTPTFY